MYAFIVNPNSRSGLGFKIWEQLELILKERHIDYQIYFTRRPGHGTKLAAQICDTDAVHAGRSWRRWHYRRSC